jgi:hypothetical protein
VLKNLLRDKVPFSFLLPVYYLDCRRRYYPPEERLRSEFQLPFVDEIDLAAYKQSDTLFVLGSGPSINRISQRRWQAIATHDSIGFNFWPYHSFVPTFYFMEGAAGEAEAQAFVELITRRANDYRGIPKVIMDLQSGCATLLPRLPEGWRQNLFYAHTVPAIARTDGEFAQVVSYLSKRGVFTPETGTRYLFKHCATLSTMVTLGVKLQYKRIVLCGIDLTTSQYYWQDQDRFPASADLRRLARDQKHATLTRFCWGNTPIDVVLEALNAQVLQPAGIELYVEHDQSALYPNIPLAPDSIFATPSEMIAGNVDGTA